MMRSILLLTVACNTLISAFLSPERFSLVAIFDIPDKKKIHRRMAYINIPTKPYPSYNLLTILHGYGLNTLACSQAIDAATQSIINLDSLILLCPLGEKKILTLNKPAWNAGSCCSNNPTDSPFLHDAIRWTSNLSHHLILQIQKHFPSHCLSLKDNILLAPVLHAFDENTPAPPLEALLSLCANNTLPLHIPSYNMKTLFNSSLTTRLNAVIGFSNGAMMALSLFCQQQIPFTHIVSIVGTLTSPCPSSPSSFSPNTKILLITAKKDSYVPRNGRLLFGLSSLPSTLHSLLSVLHPKFSDYYASRAIYKTKKEGPDSDQGIVPFFLHNMVLDAVRGAGNTRPRVEEHVRRRQITAQLMKCKKKRSQEKYPWLDVDVDVHQWQLVSTIPTFIKTRGGNVPFRNESVFRLGREKLEETRREETRREETRREETRREETRREETGREETRREETEREEREREGEMLTRNIPHSVTANLHLYDYDLTSHVGKIMSHGCTFYVARSFYEEGLDFITKDLIVYDDLLIKGTV